MDLTRGMRRADTLKYGALVVLVVQNSSLALTMRYSRAAAAQDGMYISSTAVVMSELVKLVAALGLIASEEGSVGALAGKLWREVLMMPGDFAKLLVPACLYTLQNNLAYVAVSNLDAASYQVLYQLKILTTAVFSVVLLRRHLDCGKWLALLVLVGGVSLVQLSGLKSDSSSSTAAETGNKIVGLASVLLACCSSGFAGVYFEKVLKGSEVSVWVRNVELALIGIFVGLAGVYYSDAAAVQDKGFFHGYNRIVWGVIALQALGGIVVAVVVKYADNLLKGFATSISIVVSCLVSYAFFGEVTLSPKFVLGTFLVIFSTIMYSTNPAELLGLAGGKASAASAAAAAAAASGLKLPYAGKARAGSDKGGHGDDHEGDLEMQVHKDEERGSLLLLSSSAATGAGKGDGGSPAGRRAIPFTEAAGIGTVAVGGGDAEQGMGLLQEVDLGDEIGSSVAAGASGGSSRRRGFFFG